MKWITPKTDWDKKSRLNARDYNRILNNLRVLGSAGQYCLLYAGTRRNGRGQGVFKLVFCQRV